MKYRHAIGLTAVLPFIEGFLAEKCLRCRLPFTPAPATKQESFCWQCWQIMLTEND